MRKYTPARFSAAIILGILFAASPGVVFAQQEAVKTAEPKRFALVIGNAKYDGALSPLGSPCSDDPARNTDVRLVADALTAARWEVESTCNLTTQQLRSKIDAFTDRVLAEERAFGIVYYSGHGAQVAGVNYLFGVDAMFDEEVEVKKYAQNTYAPLFGQSAVQLDYAMGRLTHLWGKAVVFIVDACRDNPIIDALRARRINTARYPAAASAQVPNVIYAFATESGAVAPDGGIGSASRYARFLAESIRKGMGATGGEIDQVLMAARTSVMKETHAVQVPGRVGDLQRPPVFCITGCPSLLEDWNSWNTEFAGAAAPSSRPHTDSPRVMLQTVKYRVGSRPPFAQDGAPPAPPAPVAPAAAAPRQALRVDILYCVGDKFEALRAGKSSALKARLQELSGARSPVAGFDIGTVSTVPMPPKVNQAIYRAEDSSVVYNDGSPAQQAWAAHISQLVTPPLRLVAQPGVASDFLTVRLCDQANLNAKPVPVYVQVASDAQKSSALALKDSFKAAFPNAAIARGVEVVSNSPDKSELRYFHAEQAGSAAMLADAAASILHEPVAAKLIPGYEVKLKGSTVMELWIGKTSGLGTGP